MNRKHTTVSGTLDRGVGKKFYSRAGTQRGKLLHNTRFRFYSELLKTGATTRVNSTVLIQRAREVCNKIREEIRDNDKFSMYYKDVNTLLKSIFREFVECVKNYAREHNWAVIPEEIERRLFGGLVTFEQEESCVLEGVQIKARIDEVVMTDKDTIIIHEFKTSLLDGENPSDLDSNSHRDFLQAGIYGIIIEEITGLTCEKVVLIYHPNKVLSYNFSNEFRSQALEFVKANGIEALGFKLVSQNDEISTPNSDERDLVKTASSKKTAETELKDNKKTLFRDPESLGWVNTDKSKPLELIKDKENKLEGYLWSNKAEYVKDGDYVAVERQDGIRIICIVEHIKCFEENTAIVLKSLNESVYIIKLNPIMELHPEGPREPRPQTILNGKITRLKEWEFYQFKKIPQHGIPFGLISDIDQDYQYYFDAQLYYQGMFMGGTQGTGKTSAIRFMTLSTAPQANSPAIIIFDAEDEFSNLPNIPTEKVSMELMAKWGIDPIHTEKLEIINLTEENDWSLTLKDIDPKHLPLFLHELPHVSSTLIQRIIQDIKYNNPNRDFTFPELHYEITEYMTHDCYRLNQSVRDAITRSLLSITLDLFDRRDVEPFDIEQMIIPGKITIIDCFNLDDDQQRIVALYLLAVFHNYKMKKAREKEISDVGVLFVLDEVTRIMPMMLSNSDYQKRILHFLSEIQHRGRKRKYGVIYATQHPKDIKKELVDLCNTKIFFLMEGSSCSYLKDYLNKEQQEQLKRLPVGYAYILSKGKHEPQIIKFPYIY